MVEPEPLPVEVMDVQTSSEPTTGDAGSLYSTLTSLARVPFFYSDLDVPDTVMGRFEMLSIVMILLSETSLLLPKVPVHQLG